MHPLDTDHLRTFVAIVDTGSFTRAADAVSKTQSAVSMQMRKLEERIGRPLFERDGRMSRLTADGERLLPYARRMLKLQAETLSAFDGATLSGSVRLGVPDDYAAFVPRILGPFSAAHPRAEITVICEPTSMLVEMLRSHAVDIALVTYAPSIGWPSARIVRREPLHWVASERYCAGCSEPVRLALGSAGVCDWARAAVAALEARGRPFQFAFLSQNAAAISEAVLVGLAVSVLPSSAVRPGMKILSEADGFPPLPSCDIAMLVRPEERHGLIGALADHVVDGLTERSAALAA